MKKKAFVIPIVVIILIVSCFYLLIPSVTQISNAVTVDASDAVTYRFLIRKNGWDKWWPQHSSLKTINAYQYKGTLFKILKTTNSGVDVQIEKGNVKLMSHIIYSSDDDNVVRLNWSALPEISLDPFKRMEENGTFKDINKQTGDLLKHFKAFLENRKNAYGYHLYISNVKDSVLLISHITTNGYPSMVTVYGLIKKLNEQVARQNIRTMNYPMANITRTGKDTYEVTTALSIDREIKPEGGTRINKMVAGGNLLVVDVTGGPNTLADAMTQAKIFMKDHKLTAPAMPFESLITDRLKESDTSKWVTKVYYPIF